jgi:hypothetical protein
MNENVISWNLPNFITIMLMVALLWAGVGFLSHFFRGASSVMKTGAAADSAGNLQ